MIGQMWLHSLFILVGAIGLAVAMAGRAPTPVPPGNLHIKHIRSQKALLYWGAGAGVAGATITLVALTRNSAAASTVTSDAMKCATFGLTASDDTGKSLSTVECWMP